MAKLKNIPVSLHCWQGDDVKGFDQDGPLTGGIQATGNYPGKARTPEELIADMEKVMALCPGAKKLNVHTCYAIFEEDGFVDLGNRSRVRCLAQKTYFHRCALAGKLLCLHIGRIGYHIVMDVFCPRVTLGQIR